MGLKDAICKNKFIITAEIVPPKGTDISEIIKKAHILRGVVDGINVPDNQRATMALSSLSVCIILKRMGLDPVFQITCRDRNRKAILEDILTAYTFGIRNALVLGGDRMIYGDHIDAMEVYDLAVHEAIKNIKDLIELEFHLNNKNFLIGAALAPEAEDVELEIKKFEKKLNAGVDFFQTQAIFDLEKFFRFIQRVKPSNARIIGGLIFIKSPKTAIFLRERLPGIKMPEHIFKGIINADDPLEQAKELLVNQIRSLSGICDGVHLMMLGREDLIPEILNRAGIIRQASHI